jgi:hypothetical protein
VLQLQEALPGLQIFRDEDLAFGAAATRAINDLEFARSQPIRLACILLAYRAERVAHRGEKRELLATALAICELEASDKVGLLKVASACASCLRSLDASPAAALTAQERQLTEKRLAERGIAALTRAVELGVKTLSRSPIDSLWPLSRFPAYQALEAKLGAPQAEPAY